ncbi:MAG: cysteine--tRNA ligase [Bdellovibrionaceae bacterium]|nr:cysteine--tRNA ligase [Pseudobdellovibrionaceae bacterium]
MNKNLKIYDTASKEKKSFTSLQPKEVKMYCCGPTVYDYLHIGNFRGAVFFNFVRNWLEFLNYKVNYIYNFTDIDDKILNRALSEKISPQELAEKYILEFKKDYNSLKLKAHTANPRATETLPEIIQLIEKLIKAKKAYEINGNVFYSVSAFKHYGQLSNRKIEDLLSGVRIEVDKQKKSPMDFALWKKAKSGEKWHFESPWGKGRPGWHIECTAMIHKFLGEEIDIHCGGSDLIFPHHENELAQSTGATNKKYVQFWMHNNMIVTEGDKMSKSLDNMITMREFLSQYPGELFKFLILSTHYRSPLQFSKKTLRQALVSLSKIYSSLKKAQQFIKKNGQTYFEKEFSQAEKDIQQAFNDDFATPKAFSIFFELLNNLQKLTEDKKTSSFKKADYARKYIAFFKKYGEALSLFQEEPISFLKNLEDKLLEQKQLSRINIEKKVKERTLARKNKDFKKADLLRKDLEGIGIELRDTAQGSEWEIKK